MPTNASSRARVLKLDSVTALTSQLASLSGQLSGASVNVVQTNVSCDHCAKNHLSANCLASSYFIQLSSE